MRARYVAVGSLSNLGYERAPCPNRPRFVLLGTDAVAREIENSMLKTYAARLFDKTLGRTLEYQKHFRRRNSLYFALRVAATEETVKFLKERAPRARYFPTKYELLSAALGKAEEPGLFIELGVKGGRTIRHIAKETTATVHGFDSFEGYPSTKEWPDKERDDGSLPDVPSNVKLHKGWFDETLPRFIAEHTETIAFLHVDCRIYPSTKTAFDILGERLRPAAVIVFDEYFNYPGWQNVEHRAFEEFLSRAGHAVDYFAISEQQLAVKILSPDGGKPS